MLHGYIAKWLIVKLLRAKDRGWILHAVRPKASYWRRFSTGDPVPAGSVPWAQYHRHSTVRSVLEFQ